MGSEKETIAGMRPNGEVAPTPAVRAVTASRLKSTLCGRSVPSTAMTGYPPYLPFAIAVRIASVGRAAVYQRSGFEYSGGY